jgi:tetratricopeptide (TPR) repeat protein
MLLAKQQQDDRLKMLAIIGGWVILFLVGIFAYWPGLKGPFVLDDFGSIAALGDRGGVTNWDTFKTFVFGGHAGPTGRPLALLSFLIDANNWPADPWPFKRTNLVIHLINGALLGFLTARILQLLNFARQDARWIALVSTACWLLHPFLVSTTLYAVQRMAQLSTLFVFAGLITYLHGRSLLATQTVKAYLIMSVAVGLFTFLAMISKENGILLPLLIGVVEITVIRSQKQRLAALNPYWSIVFIVVPSTMVALYLGERVMRDDFFEAVPPRNFSTYEGLITQPRVLVDYLRHWFIPELYTSGIFQDHFIKSTGILSPVTTLLSVLLHLAAVSIALIKRRKWPLFALATLFFYGSLVLESSVLNLELYFEHRNYLAAAFLLLPLIALLQNKLSRSFFLAVAIAAPLVLAGFTRYSAGIWQEFPSIVEASARKAPTSARAQAQYATQLYNAQRYDESLQVIERAIRNDSNDRPLLLVNRLIILCQLGSLTAQEFERVAGLLSKRPYDGRSIKLYTELASSVVKGKCPDVSVDALGVMFANMLLVPYNADRQSLAYSHINYFVGFADVYAGRPAQAAAAFKESLQARPGASHAMIMAAHLATGEYFEEALYFSEVALTQMDVQQQGVLRLARVSEDDIRTFQDVVRADRDAAQTE